MDCNTHLGRALARRDRHRDRPLVIRAPLLAGVALIAAASVDVYIRYGFLPPLLFPVLVALLALEFQWAARLLAWGLERLGRFWRRIRKLVRRLPA